MHRQTLLTFAAFAATVIAQQPVPPSQGAPLPPISCLDQQQDRVRPPRPVQSELVAFPQQAAPQQKVDERGSVPAGASSAPVSAGFDLEQVVFDQPETGGPIWTRTASYKASCDADGWTFYPRLLEAPSYQTVRSTLRSVKVGSELLRWELGAPQLQDARVQWQRGSFVEQVEMGKGGAEHSFRFDTLPNRGAVEVVIAIDSRLECQARSGGLRFHGPHGDVDYSQAVAVDAGGKRLPLETIWSEGAVHIKVPQSFMAAAVLPLRIDPVLTTSVVLGTRLPLSNPDIAYQTADITYVTVCELEYTAYDHDVIATDLDFFQMQPRATVNLDATSADWRKPRIAYHSHTGVYLTVAEVQSVPSFIAARPFSGRTLAMQPALVVEQAGVVGIPGVKTDPDVGGGDTPWGSSQSSYFTVVWCNRDPASGTLGDIYFKQVDAMTGVLRSTMPTAIVADNWNSVRPRINKSVPASNYLTGLQRGLVTWYESPASNRGATDISGALLTWDGQFVPVGGYSMFYIDSSAGIDFCPAVGRPVRMDPVTIGPLAHLVTWERMISGQTDLIGAIVDETGRVHTRVDLNLIEGGGSYQGWSQRLPAVDSDGTRFVVAYQEQYQGNLDWDTRVSTFAWLPGSNSIVVVESRRQLAVGSLTDDTTQPCLAASLPTLWLLPIEFGIVAVNYAPSGQHALNGFRYRALGAGGFASPSGFGCGVLGITASGLPTTGQYVYFQLSTAHATGVIAFGTRTDSWLPGCPACRLGTTVETMHGSSASFAIPPNTALIGTTMAVQGWAPTGGSCLGTLALSNLITMTIQ